MGPTKRQNPVRSTFPSLCCSMRGRTRAHVDAGWMARASKCERPPHRNRCVSVGATEASLRWDSSPRVSPRARSPCNTRNFPIVRRRSASRSTGRIDSTRSVKYSQNIERRSQGHKELRGSTGMVAHRLTPILNVSDIEESFAWFEKLGWKRAWDWGDPPRFGGTTSGVCEIFLCQDGQGGRTKRP